jgi:hypothetical protein
VAAVYGDYLRSRTVRNHTEEICDLPLEAAQTS